jgi:hypothetical protein
MRGQLCESTPLHLDRSERLLASTRARLSKRKLAAIIIAKRGSGSLIHQQHWHRFRRKILAMRWISEMAM